MTDLSGLPIRLSYRTGRDDLVRDFFNPCLERAVLYRRAAGYFTSAGLALAARGVASLATRGGKMQLVVSPYLDADDVEALLAAKENPVAALRAIAAKNLSDIEDALIKDRLNALAWLAASGLLTIKLALRRDGAGGYARGLYHEKAGIFTDAAGHHVAFSGSSNETAGGLLENFESIKAFCSWKDPEGRVQEELDNFDALWADSTPGLQVLEFTAATFEAPLAELPAGTFIELGGEAFLVWRGGLLRWSFVGYGSAPLPFAPSTPVCVLTPRSVVQVFRSGFVPTVHVSAGSR